KIYSFQGSSEPFSFAQFFHRSFDTINWLICLLRCPSLPLQLYDLIIGRILYKENRIIFVLLAHS
ncbi:hypothetical protein, partial [Roseburia intestinalis]|uniref:hypothetical protein n=1 Tax=Roseburia intestinalis TaxID=166486 RepID=UPI0032BF549D